MALERRVSGSQVAHSGRLHTHIICGPVHHHQRSAQHYHRCYHKNKVVYKGTPILAYLASRTENTEHRIHLVDGEGSHHEKVR